MELSKKEKKFLSNPKLMRKAFGIYGVQADILYNYFREIAGEEVLFDRFKNIHIKISAGLNKRGGEVASKGENRTFNHNGRQYGQVKYYALSGENVITENGIAVQENAGLARYKFFNSRLSEATSRRFSPMPERVSRSRARTTGERAEIYKNVKINSQKDMLYRHKTIYHEMAHGMGRQVGLIETPAAGTVPEHAVRFAGVEQVVYYRGTNAVYGYELKDKNKRGSLLWKNVGKMYLEEGVVDSIATECVATEIESGRNPLLAGVDKAAAVRDVRENSCQYTTPLGLVGMWNAVSDNELIKQHVGVQAQNAANFEATEIFKKTFGDYMVYLTGNEYNPRTQSLFTAQKLESILQKYQKCVTICEQYFGTALASGDLSRADIARFEDYHSIVTDPNVICSQIESYVSTNNREAYYLFNRVGKFCVDNWQANLEYDERLFAPKENTHAQNFEQNLANNQPLVNNNVRSEQAAQNSAVAAEEMVR